MELPSPSQDPLDFFKALADSNRLKIIGLLAREPMPGEQIAALLNLHPSTVSHHLAILAIAGVVSARAEGYYNVYQLEEKTMERMVRQVLARENLSAAGAAIAADAGIDAYDRKVLNNFLGKDGRFKSLPEQQKKFEVVLRYVIKAFEPGTRYTEKQVNEILGRYHKDTAALRRGLIESVMLLRERDGSAYWLPPSNQERTGITA